jgi:hypothetical protein
MIKIHSKTIIEIYLVLCIHLLSSNQPRFYLFYIYSLYSKNINQTHHL